MEYRLKEFPLMIWRAISREPPITKLDWAMGLSPENRIIGPNIISNIRVNPSQPTILAAQVNGFPNSVLVLAKYCILALKA